MKHRLADFQLRMVLRAFPSHHGVYPAHVIGQAAADDEKHQHPAEDRDQQHGLRFFLLLAFFRFRVFCVGHVQALLIYRILKSGAERLATLRSRGKTLQLCDAGQETMTLSRPCCFAL